MTEGPRSSNSIWDQLRERMQAVQDASRTEGVSAASLTERLMNRAKVLRGRMQAAKDEGDQQVILAFSKGRERYGVPISHVLEVQPLDQFSPVPKAPPFIRGVVQCRGAILALLDLGILFEVQATGLADVHIYIVVETAGRRVAVVAGDVEEIIGIRPDDVKPAPELPSGVHPDWVQGVHDENRLLLRMEEVLQDEKLSNWRPQ